MKAFIGLHTSQGLICCFRKKGKINSLGLPVAIVLYFCVCGKTQRGNIIFNHKIYINTIMKYCCLLMVVFVLATLVVVEAKKKPNNNKFEGDFEFVDEVSHKLYLWSIGSKEYFKNLRKKCLYLFWG